MTPYYSDQNGISIYHGDARDIWPTLGRADLVLTDPPYGIAKQKRTYSKRSGAPEAWDEEFPTWWLEYIDAPILGWMPGVSNLARLPENIGPLGYRWMLAIHVANGMTRGPLGYGNWIPCAVYTEPEAKIYSQQNDVARVAISGPRPNHPAPKPVSAMDWLLTRLPGDRIIDPFMGSGTTLISAKKAGRSCAGIEISEEYCQIAAERLMALSESDSLKVN